MSPKARPPVDGPTVAINSRWETFERTAAFVVLALGARVLYLFIRYVLGFGAERFQVESGAMLFLVVGLTYRLARRRRFVESESTMVKGVRPSLWLAFCALAIALYWPAISFDVIPADSAVMREAFGWNLLLEFGAGAAALHLLNLLLHGTNAYLATKVIGGWVHDRTWSLLGGLLVLTAPLAIEPVASLLRVFDLLATTLVLTCILIARRYDDHPTLRTRVCFVAVGIAAVASKETAVVVGGLVLLDGWVRSARSRALFVDTGILVVGAGLFSAIRLSLVSGIALPPLNKFAIQLALFRSFGGLAVPWHVEVIQRYPWLPILGVLTVVYLFTTFFLAPVASRRGTQLAIAGAAWVLLSIAPAFPIELIDPDLQRSSYLYLSAVGWAALITALASDQWRGFLRLPSLTAMSVLIAIATTGTVLHLGYAGEAVRVARRVEISRERLFAELQPVRLANCEFRRFGEPNDGGYLLCANLLSSVRSGYSYGISGYDQWGCDVSRALSVPMHQYDCFNLTRPVCLGGRTEFHEECIGGELATLDGRLFDSLENQFAKNGDGGKQVIVKMDVEGAEWESLQRTPDAVFEKIDQLTIELHGVGEERFLSVVQKLKQFFYVANIHYNNFACLKGIEPFPAEVYEVLFVSKRLAVPGGSGAAGAPPELAAPNNPQWQDCQAVIR